MVDFNLGRSKTEVEGCVTSIEVVFDNEGELSMEGLEEIDNEMTSIGASRTGQRIRVNSRPDSDRSSVVYVYQEVLQFSTKNQMKYWFERFEMKTRYKNPTYKFGTEVVGLRDYNAEEGSEGS